jgi:hypothetical protein
MYMKMYQSQSVTRYMACYNCRHNAVHEDAYAKIGITECKLVYGCHANQAL